MKKILILGASSEIGRSISIKYAKHNHLFLIGRSTAKLKKTEKFCNKAAAKKINIIIQDFSKPFKREIIKSYKYQFDIIINLISSSSRLKDNSLNYNLLKKTIQSDILSPINYCSKILKNSKYVIKIILITSILEEIRTPNRYFYSAIKNILTIITQNLSKEHANLELLIVKIGTQIPHDKASKKTEKLAKAILFSDVNNNKFLYFGWQGLLLKALYFLFPIVIDSLIKLNRLVKNKSIKNKSNL